MTRRRARSARFMGALAWGFGGCAGAALAAGPAGIKLDGSLGGSAAVLTGPSTTSPKAWAG